MKDWSRVIFTIFTVISLLFILEGMTAEFNVKSVVTVSDGLLLWVNGTLIAIYMRLRN